MILVDPKEVVQPDVPEIVHGQHRPGTNFPLNADVHLYRSRRFVVRRKKVVWRHRAVILQNGWNEVRVWSGGAGSRSGGLIRRLERREALGNRVSRARKERTYGSGRQRASDR